MVHALTLAACVASEVTVAVTAAALAEAHTSPFSVAAVACVVVRYAALIWVTTSSAVAASSAMSANAMCSAAIDMGCTRWHPRLKAVCAIFSNPLTMSSTDAGRQGAALLGVFATGEGILLARTAHAALHSQLPPSTAALVLALLSCIALVDCSVGIVLLYVWRSTNDRPVVQIGASPVAPPHVLTPSAGQSPRSRIPELPLTVLHGRSLLPITPPPSGGRPVVSKRSPFGFVLPRTA